MNHIKSSNLNLGETAVAFGRFDGVHKGHRVVLDKLIEQENRGLDSVMLSLDYKSFDSFGTQDVLYTEEEKVVILENDPPKIMISYPFDEDTAGMCPEKFIKNILVNKLGAKVIVAGSTCRFGKERKGTIHTLMKFAPKYNYEVVECDVVEKDSKPITSQWIRTEFAQGNLGMVNELLGHTFTLIGKVVHGKALGRTVGMPTANLDVGESKFIPKHGVYATLSEIDGKIVQGLTNIGKRPSVDNHNYVTVETFLLDFSKDIYNKEIALELHSYIRGVVKFNSLDEVKAQVEKDIASVRSYLNLINKSTKQAVLGQTV